MKLFQEFFVRVVFAVSALALFQSAVQAATDGQAETLLTVESKQADVPTLHREDVMLYQGHDRVNVTNLTPLAGRPAEVFVAIDEAVGPVIGPQINDISKFILAQPPGVAVGVAYMREGTVDILQKPTTDHAAAAKTIRIPTAQVGSSPYESLTDLIKKWPSSSARREIVMVSSGIEPFGGNEVSNPLVDAAVTSAQRAQIPVFIIYTPAAGHFGHSFWRTTWAQTYLSRLADETGGEGYNLNGLTIVSFTPFLTDISQRLQRQYLVAFTPKPQEKSGSIPIHATTELPHIELVTPDRVWIGGE